MQNVTLLVATKKVVFLEYEKFKWDFKLANKEYVLSVEVRQFHLSNIINQMSQNHVYSSREYIFYCNHHFTQYCQYIREIKLCDEFSVSDFFPKYFCGTKVIGLLNGWVPIPHNYVCDNIGVGE